MTNLDIDAACSSLIDILNSTLLQKKEIAETIQNELIDQNQKDNLDRYLKAAILGIESSDAYWPNIVNKRLSLEQINEYTQKCIIIAKDLPFAQGPRGIALELGGGYITKLIKCPFNLYEIGDESKIIKDTHYICNLSTNNAGIKRILDAEMNLKLYGFGEYIVSSEARKLVFDETYKIKYGETNMMLYQDLRQEDKFELVNYNKSWPDIKNSDEIKKNRELLEKKLLSIFVHRLDVYRIRESLLIQVDKKTRFGKLYIEDIKLYAE